IVGSQRPATTTKMDGYEVIALESKLLDGQVRTMINQHSAVERIVPISTPYKLVSRVFKAEDSGVVVGDTSWSQSVTIGGSAPVIMAGPCAVESKEQLLS